MTATIAHRSKNHAQHGAHVMAAPSVVDLPEHQAMIRRLGENVSSINAASIDRCAYVAQLAATIIARKRVTR